MTDTGEWPDPADRAYAIEQVDRLRDQAVKGGLQFEAYLPRDLAFGFWTRLNRASSSIRRKPCSFSCRKAAIWSRMPICAVNCSRAGYRRRSTIPALLYPLTR